MTNKTDQGGCDVCRAQFVDGSYPSVVFDDVDGHRVLYRCAVCHTYWEETERYVVPVEDDYALGEYPGIIDAK